MLDMGKQRRSGQPKTANEIRTEATQERPTRPTRRSYTTEFKQRVVSELAAAAASGEPGAQGAVLRREGLPWSTVHRWQTEAAKAELTALAPKKRGRKPSSSATDKEMARLQRENARLQEELRKAALIIDVQKKLSALLGLEMPETDSDDES